MPVLPWPSCSSPSAALALIRVTEDSNLVSLDRTDPENEAGWLGQAFVHKFELDLARVLLEPLILPKHQKHLGKKRCTKSCNFSAPLLTSTSFQSMPR